MFLRVLENESRNARPNATRRAAFEASHLEVRMFNVDHGEAILLVFDGGRAWLVDSGCSNARPRNELLGQRLLDYLEVQGLTLEAVVATHPHVDHAGAFATILASNSSQIATPLRIYRREDATWRLDRRWLESFRNAIGGAVEEIALQNAHREVTISSGVRAHLFAGSGQGAYTSVFVHLRYHDARLLFTGDAKCEYEIELLAAFGEEDFRADALKVTHHGSSSGTARSVLDAIRPGIAFSSTGDDAGHRLERDTLDRLGGRPVGGPPPARRVFETLIDGDIILQTDGRPYRGGLLYKLEFESPGRFADDLRAEVKTLAEVDPTRTSSPHSACN